MGALGERKVVAEIARLLAEEYDAKESVHQPGLRGLRRPAQQRRPARARVSIVFVEPPSPPGFVAFRHPRRLRRALPRQPPAVSTLDLFHGASLLLDHGIAACVIDSVLQEHAPRDCVAAILAEDPSMVVFRTSFRLPPHDPGRGGLLKSSGFGGRSLLRAARRRSSRRPSWPIPGVDAVLLAEASAPSSRSPGPGAFAESRGRGSSARPHFQNPRRPGRRTSTPCRSPVGPGRLPKYSYVTSQTSWGCPYGCGYCPYPVTQGALGGPAPSRVARNSRRCAGATACTSSCCGTRSSLRGKGPPRSAAR